jgi:hypothetical protein
MEGGSRRRKRAVALKPDDCNAWGRLAAIYFVKQDKRREADNVISESVLVLIVPKP